MNSSADGMSNEEKKRKCGVSRCCEFTHDSMDTGGNQTFVNATRERARGRVAERVRQT
jgi:hypothetical protein